MIYPDCDMKRWSHCDNSVVLANADYYYTKEQVDKKFDDFDGVTDEEVQRMINTSIRTKADKADVNALSGQVQANTDAIDNTYTKQETNAAVTAATTPINNTLTAHTADTSIHVTSAEKTYWNNKLDASAYTPTDLSNYYTKQETNEVVNGAVSGKADTTAVTQEVSSAVAPLFGAVEYDSQTQRINFKHDATGQTIAYVDATDFIKDGMVSNVEISNGNLVITFNSDAGKQPISIPLTDIFNPANYYTTAQTQSYVSGFTYDKATIDQKVASGGTFDPDLYYDKTATDALLAAKADTATTYTKTEVDTALSGKADSSAVTAVASDVSTVSGQVATKVATSDFNTYTAATASALSGKQDALVYYEENTEDGYAEMRVATDDGDGNTSDQHISIGGGLEMGDYQEYNDGQGNSGFTSTNIQFANPEIYMYAESEENGENEATHFHITPLGVTINYENVATEPYVDAATSGKVETSAIITSMTSSSTDAQVPSAKAVYDQMGGLKLVSLTQAQYDQLATKDASTIYFING